MKDTNIQTAENTARIPVSEKLHRWEEEKGYQKKLDTLREKLKQKTNELEVSLQQNSHLKENLTRSEHDRLRLQRKLKQIPKNSQDQENNLKQELVTLQTKVAELQFALKTAKRVKQVVKEVDLPMKIDSELGDKSNQELLDIISQLELKEKSIQKEVTDLERQNSKLKKEIHQAAERELGAKESVLFVKKIDDENNKLRAKLRKEMDKTKSAMGRIDELTVANEQLIKDIVSLRKLVSGVPENETKSHEQSELIITLKEKLSEKEKLINEMLSDPDSNECSRLTTENRKLKRELELWQLRVSKMTNESRPVVSNTKMYEENQSLKSQLQKINEEVEDLRYNYKELLRTQMSSQS